MITIFTTPPTTKDKENARTQPLSIEDVRNAFFQAFHTLRPIRPAERYRLHDYYKTSNYRVYNFNSLPILLQRLKNYIQIDGERDYSNKIRCVVTSPEQQMLFSYEGTADTAIPHEDNHEERIPSHRELSESVLTSGVITMNEHQEITEISNFSGHFQPEYGTLVFMIALLIQNQATFASEIKLTCYSKGRYTALHEQSISVSYNDLVSLVPTEQTLRPQDPFQITQYEDKKDPVIFTSKEEVTPFEKTTKRSFSLSFG